MSDPQVGPRYQPSQRSDGWHEGSGGGGGQRRQHWPGTPEGSGENSLKLPQHKGHHRSTNGVWALDSPLLMTSIWTLLLSCRWTNTRLIWPPWCSPTPPPSACLRSTSEKFATWFTRTAARSIWTAPTWTPRWERQMGNVGDAIDTCQL